MYNYLNFISNIKLSSINFLNIKKYIYGVSVGIKNKLKYGHDAPRFGDLIYVDPREYDSFIDLADPTFDNLKTRACSGTVKSGNWDKQPQKKIENLIRYRACVQHWTQNISWKDTGIYDFMLEQIELKGSVDDCYTLEDVIKRYEKLDELFKEIKLTRKFKTQKELNSLNIGENGGILFHIDRNNNPLWAAGGVHRFSMAKILNLDSIPAQLGVVHLNAIKEWKTHKRSK
jgi:hypothetical protein